MTPAVPVGTTRRSGVNRAARKLGHAEVPLSGGSRRPWRRARTPTDGPSRRRSALGGGCPRADNDVHERRRRRHRSSIKASPTTSSTRPAGRWPTPRGIDPSRGRRLAGRQRKPSAVCRRLALAEQTGPSPSHSSLRPSSPALSRSSTAPSASREAARGRSSDPDPRPSREVKLDAAPRPCAAGLCLYPVAKAVGVSARSGKIALRAYSCRSTPSGVVMRGHLRGTRGKLRRRLGAHPPGPTTTPSACALGRPHRA